MSSPLTPAQAKRIRRLNNPADPHNTRNIARIVGVSIKIVQQILAGKKPKSYTPERAAEQLAHRQALRAERDAHWREMEPMARARIEAGEDLPNIAADLGVGMDRLISLRRSIREGRLAKAA